MDIREKLQLLKKKMFDFQSDQEEVKRWEIEVLEALAINSINEKAGVVMIKDRFEKKIQAINDMLLTDKELTFDSRKALMEIRDEYTNLLNIFRKIDLTHIEDEIDQNIEI